MPRSPMSSDESGLKKGPWTPEEDDKLVNHIQKHGHGSWRALPRVAGLNRCGKSCRLRWTNYLRPDIKRGKFSQEEEQTILNLHAILGNKWSAIATHLPGRTDNEIKNFWNTHLKKKLIQMGFDPMTHRPRTDIFATLPHLIALASLIDNPDQALQALQMARLSQCLQNLLPPEASILTGHLDPHFLHESMEYPHLPDLQAPCTKGLVNGQGTEFCGMVGQEESSPPSWLLPPTPASAPVIANTVDACNTSSYDAASAAQMWSELLDDPIFNDIP